MAGVKVFKEGGEEVAHLKVSILNNVCSKVPT